MTAQDPWYRTFDGTFWLTLAGLFIGFLGVVAKSKCSRFSCCGLVVERDVRAEVELEEHMAHPPRSPTRNRTNSTLLNTNEIAVDIV